jgi:putative intracellular protease/amidase
MRAGIRIARQQVRAEASAMKKTILALLAAFGFFAPALTALAETKPVLIVLTSHGKLGDTGKPTGFFLSELTHPLEVFEKAGLPVEFASIQGGEPPVDGLDLGDPVNARYWNNPAFRAKLAATKKLSDVDPGGFSAVFFSGGHGTMWDFPDNPAVQKVAAAVYESGAPVGAVCHGPAALVNVKLSDGTYLVAGKKVAAFTNSEEEKVGLTKTVPFLLATKLGERGAKHTSAPDFEKNVAVDGFLVTGQNPASASGVAGEMVGLLKED